MNSILYEKEITLNAIDSAYEKGKKDGSDSIVEELERINNYISRIRNTGMGKNKSLDFIEKFVNGIKTERREQ